MMEAKELSIQTVGKNEVVIRRQFRDEQGRRITMFLARLAATDADNEAIANEFISGISVLNALKPIYDSLIEKYGGYDEALARYQGKQMTTDKTEVTEITIELLCRSGVWYWLLRYRVGLDSRQAVGKAASAEEALGEAMKVLDAEREE